MKRLHLKSAHGEIVFARSDRNSRNVTVGFVLMKIPSKPQDAEKSNLTVIPSKFKGKSQRKSNLFIHDHIQCILITWPNEGVMRFCRDAVICLLKYYPQGPKGRLGRRFGMFRAHSRSFMYTDTLIPEFSFAFTVKQTCFQRTPQVNLASLKSHYNGVLERQVGPWGH